MLDFPFMAAKKRELTAAEAELRKIGMAFPEATEDFPWGHRALKVKGKAFVFMSNEEGVFSLSVKLPDSADFALMQTFAQPTGYGLGKSGWVSASFGKKDAVPVQLLGSWLRESYLAIAPKKLAGQLRTLPAKASQRPKAGDAKPARTAKAEPKPAGKKTVKRKK